MSVTICTYANSVQQHPLQLPVQLSVAILPWVGTMSTDDSCGDYYERNDKFSIMVDPGTRTVGMVGGRFITVGSLRGWFITRSIHHQSIHYKNCYMML